MRLSSLFPIDGDPTSLIERRRNPEQNPRVGVIDFLSQHKDNPKAYLHTANIPKVGIYPKSSSGHDSPAGIYAYRLADIWTDYIEAANTGEHQGGLEYLPYRGGDHLFILESDIDPDFPDSYSEADLARDAAKIQRLFGFPDERMKRLRASASTNLNFRDCPAGYLWGITKAICAGIDHEFDQYTSVDTLRWNSLLRRLGYVGFNDPGKGLIHGAEATQALFLTTSAFRVVDHMLANRKQRSVEIEGNKYKGGRVPKNLYMKSISNTLFYNHKPADFSGVHTWTVGFMGLDELGMFNNFVPWNATGVVQHLGIGSAANVSYEMSFVRRYFERHPTLPKNIKVENIHVGGRMPVTFIKLIPPEFPVQTITISELALKHGLDSLPEPIKAKLRIQPLRSAA